MRINDITRNLNIIIDNLPEEVNRTLSDIGYIVENKAAENCPTKTHNLQRSIRNEVNEDEHYVEIGTNVDYACAVHEGHGSYSGVPFLQMAFDSERDEIEAKLQGLLERSHDHG